MTPQRLSDSDRVYREEFETQRVEPATFDHRAHVRIAYIYLAELDDDSAFLRMRDALRNLLRKQGIPETKYHETLTRAWLLAVKHFMSRTPDSDSAEAFLAANPILLDSKVMLTHYSTELLFSPRAREGFVEPDRDAIPRHSR